MVSPGRDDDRPLAERLGERLGVDVDPRVTLDMSTLPSTSRDDSSPSSGLLERLSSRPVVTTRYRIDGEIARGGMGAILDVWDSDVRRQLAMKVALTRGGDGSSGAASEVDPMMLARFLEEAQVTGQLEHPGIVPVHEFGITEDGQVFFTMRRVRGHDLEHVFGLVDKQQDDWTVPRAVGLLQKVCEAMAYAHSKGVVHRDLKPANVMVGSFGEVYVMDWGLVRVQGHEDRHDLRIDPEAQLDVDARETPAGSASDALYTMDGDVLGTPTYMSPEQARGEVSSLDARSDVYAMGAILYRLLAGHPPYLDGSKPRNGLEVVQALRAGPPDSLSTVAPSAPLELVAIADKAMAREPAARYDSMVELEEDLRAFLEQRVVGAYETGAWAEARKWVRRNRALAASLLVGVLALAGGLGVSLIEKERADANALLAEANEARATDEAANANRQRLLALASAEEAARQAAEAARQAAIAEEVNRFLNDDLLLAVQPDEAGVDVTVREVLEVATARLDGRFADEPLIEARLRRTIGEAHASLSGYDAANVSLERALVLQRQFLGERDPDTLDTFAALATGLDDAGESERAVELFTEVLPFVTDVYGRDAPETLTVLANFGAAKVHLGEYDEAIDIYEDAIDRAGIAEVVNELTLKTNLALAYRGVGRLRDAKRLQLRVLSLQELALGDLHVETLTARDNLSATLLDLGEFDRARELGEAVVEGRRATLGDDHVMTGQAVFNLGVAYRQLGDFGRAEERIREGHATLRAKLGDEHWRVLQAENSLATVLGDLSRRDEQLDVLESLLERSIPALGAEHAVTMSALGNLAILYLSTGRLQDAKTSHEALIAVERRVRGSIHPSTLTTIENYGNVLYSLGDYEGAFAALEEVLEGRREVLGERHPDVAKTATNFGMVTRYAGQRELARVRFTKAIALWRDATAIEVSSFVTALRQGGELARDAEDHVEALALFEEGAALMEGSPREKLYGDLLYAAGVAAWKSDDLDRAEELGARAVAAHTISIGPNAIDTLTSRYAYGGHLRRLGRLEEAEAELLAFIERLEDAHGADHPNMRYGRESLASLYEELGREDEADEWRDP